MSESSIRKLTEFVFDQILHLKDEIDNNKNRKLFSRCLALSVLLHTGSRPNEAAYIVYH